MKTTVIVGGSSGIGLALVQILANTDIVNISRTPCPTKNVKNLLADVTDAAALEKAFGQIPEIDTLVYCAGTSLAAPIACVERDDYRRLFEVNVLGAIECIRLAMKKLEKSGDGRILLLSSAAAVTPIPFDSFYDGAKAALVQLAYALRLEAPNIKTTAAIIGGVRTRFTFKRKVYTDCGEYDEALKSATSKLKNIEQHGDEASFVAQKLYEILQAKNPPPAKAIGIKNALFVGLYRILPWRLKLFAVRKIFINS
ncbi:MAG: SDR family NAD(P)-dependent oxidoreductase [Clostridiales bacterium]|nr:SDR family NAD(P)-dependent oxidoreductase [Clostridiales bacterium]